MAKNDDRASNQFLEELKNDFIKLFRDSEPSEALQELLNSMPSAAAVLTPQRQTIFANYNLINSLGYESLENIMGKRPGEVLGCLHALENENQCGISESCRFCGALLAMKRTQATKATSVFEMRLEAMQKGIRITQDLKITVSPILMNEKIYMILYINDISHEKRRHVLEKIFFHDVLNKVSSLYGISELLRKENNHERHKELMTTVDYIINDITGEILEQRELIAAEKGDIVLRKENVSIMILLSRVVSQLKLLNNPNKAAIIIDNESEEMTFRTDTILLNRVVTNMAKNALEASGKNEIVTLKAIKSADKILISVHNKAHMNEDTKLQVFHRSFSTKGEGRGLGTYSIKLLTERYLGGKARFESSQEKGTTFFIELPL